MDSEFLITTPKGQLTLKRFPEHEHPSLRAWNTADEYLLNHAYSEFQEEERSINSCLVLNDNFGALTLGMAANKVSSWSDSKIALDSIQKNAGLNDIDLASFELIPSTEAPTGTFDLVLIQVPKNLSLLNYQLYQLRKYTNPNSRIFLGGMIKHLPKSLVEISEKLLGPTSAKLAWKKARIFEVHFNPDLNATEPETTSEFQLENTPYTIVNYPNVFSRQSLDIGTRFFINHIPSGDYEHIVDVGCGNGIVSLIAAERNPNAKVTACDESYFAVHSAKETISRAETQEINNQFAFQAQDCLTGLAPNSADLVLCNPPFHLQQTVGDHIAKRMFKQAKKVLKKEGELWIVGNRHLGYHVQLKKLFGNCKTIDSNKKFVILKAVKLR